MEDNISVGEFECKLFFSDWNGSVTIFAIEEHIVNAIQETFNTGLASPAEIKTITFIEITNIEI